MSMRLVERAHDMVKNRVNRGVVISILRGQSAPMTLGEVQMVLLLTSGHLHLEKSYSPVVTIADDVQQGAFVELVLDTTSAAVWKVKVPLAHERAAVAVTARSHRLIAAASPTCRLLWLHHELEYTMSAEERTLMDSLESMVPPPTDHAKNQPVPRKAGSAVQSAAESHAALLNSLGGDAFGRADYPDARVLYDEALDVLAKARPLPTIPTKGHPVRKSFCQELWSVLCEYVPPLAALDLIPIALRKYFPHWLRRALLRERPPPLVATVLCNAAFAAIRLGCFAEAEELAHHATLVHETMAKAHFRRGVALAELKRYDEAAGSLRRALELQPGDSAVCERLSAVVEASSASQKR